MKTTGKNDKKFSRQKQKLVLEISIISFLLLYVGLSPQGIIITLIVFCLIGSSFFQFNSVGIYLMVLLGLANLSRLLGTRVDLVVMVCTVLLGAIILWKFQEKILYRKESRFLQRFLMLLLAILTFSKMFITDNPFLILSEFGYDQVGHFAMTMALTRGDGFLPTIDPSAQSVPTNYLYYPHQWHIFASLFVNLGSLDTQLWSYLFALLISFFVSLYFVNSFVSKCFSAILNNIPKRKSNKNISLFHLKRLVILGQVLPVIFLTLVMNMGYPNFIFSLSLIVLSLLFFNRNFSSFTLSVLALYFATSSYTLMLVPCTILVIAGAILILPKVSGSNVFIFFILMISWASFVSKILYTSFSRSHIEYIDIGGGSIDYRIVIFGLCSLAALFTGLRMKFSRILEIPLELKVLNFLNFVLLINLIGLSALTGFLGQANGYYVRKFSYLVFVIALLTLFLNWLARYMARGEYGWIGVKRVQLFIKSGLALVIVWTILPNVSYVPVQKISSVIPFPSPFLPIIRALDANEAKHLRLREIQTAAEFSRANSRPILVLSDSSAPDTQWANSLSGHWAGFLNDFLEDQEENELQFRDKQFQESISSKVSIYQTMTGK